MARVWAGYGTRSVADGGYLSTGNREPRAGTQDWASPGNKMRVGRLAAWQGLGNRLLALDRRRFPADRSSREGREKKWQKDVQTVVGTARRSPWMCQTVSEPRGICLVMEVECNSAPCVFAASLMCEARIS